MYKRVNELLGTNFKSDKEVNWVDISINHNLNEDFIEEFSNYLYWEFISEYQVLSENFIRKYKDKVNWGIVSKYQPMSEEFIEKYKDKVDWDSISVNQILSWDSILRFKDLVNWRLISLSQIYINSDYKGIKLDELKNNKLYNLYQQTKERGWFIGYIRDLTYRYPYFYRYIVFSYYIKVQIYWKDLIMLSRVKNYEFIREVKYV